MRVVNFHFLAKWRISQNDIGFPIRNFFWPHQTIRQGSGLNPLCKHSWSCPRARQGSFAPCAQGRVYIKSVQVTVTGYPYSVAYFVLKVFAFTFLFLVPDDMPQVVNPCRNKATCPATAIHDCKRSELFFREQGLNHAYRHVANVARGKILAPIATKILPYQFFIHRALHISFRIHQCNVTHRGASQKHSVPSQPKARICRTSLRPCSSSTGLRSCFYLMPLCLPALFLYL